MEHRFTGEWRGRRLLVSESGVFDEVSFMSRKSRQLMAMETPLGAPASETGAAASPAIMPMPPMNPPPSNPPPSNASSFQTLDPNVVIILVVLLFALICAAFLNTVMRCLLRRSHNRRAAEAGGPGAAGDHSVEGLDSKTLESLPIFSFKSAEKSKETETDCTICLSEFVENERLRLLPKCGHTFHLDCIDMWLLSHVSCPVCRDAIGDDPSVHSVVVGEHSEESRAHDHASYSNPTNAAQQLQLAEAAPNLRAELLRSNTNSTSTAITVTGEEAPGTSRRTLRSTLFSMFDRSHHGAPQRLSQETASTSHSPAVPALPAARNSTS